METTNESIRQLLEMLDHPEAYTEQEIHDIINHDEDTRETYRLMVEAKRGSRSRHDDTPVDVDAAWQRFNQRLQPKQQGQGWMKIAASFIGLLIVSGIAFAAIHIVRHYVEQDTQTLPQETQMVEPRQQVALDDTVKSETTDTIAPRATIEPVIFDNVPLEEMLTEIADHYDATVTFANDKARQLRFRFVWNPQQDISQVVSDLNQFESLTVTLVDNQITVE